MAKTCRRSALALALGAVLLLTASCGREAPVYEPGRITVASDPAGAAIFIDGQNTGQITPYTFTDLAVSRYEVTVELAGHVTTPTSQTVQLQPLDDVTVDFALILTGLTVDSDPQGAAIYLDGADTGLVTPATVTGLAAGTADLSLVHPLYHFYPETTQVVIVDGEVTNIGVDAFTARAKRTVMLEGFSNVDCNGCPELAVMVGALMSEAAYPVDRVLYIKFSRNFPNFLDPHYRYNTVENNDRNTYYGGLTAIPTLFVDGALSGIMGSPPELADLRDLVDTELAVDPGFLIDVTADFTYTDVTGTVSLTAAEDLDLSGHTLYIALVQELVTYDEPPGSQGETEFHWVFRDRQDALPTLGALTGGTPADYSIALTRDDWDLETLAVVAFVQNDNTKSIVQAGSTADVPHVAAAQGRDRALLHRPLGGSIR